MKPRFILCLLLLSSQALAKKTVTKQAKARLLGKSKTKSISKSSKDEQAANNRGVKGETGSKNERKNRSETAKPKASEDKVSPTSDSSPGEKRSAGKSAKSPGQDDTSSSSNAALNDGRTSGKYLEHLNEER